MIISKKQIADQIGRTTKDLLCEYGLQKAKKIATGVKKNLLAEGRRRKELEEKRG